MRSLVHPPLKAEPAQRSDKIAQGSKPVRKKITQPLWMLHCSAGLQGALTKQLPTQPAWWQMGPPPLQWEVSLFCHSCFLSVLTDGSDLASSDTTQDRGFFSSPSARALKLFCNCRSGREGAFWLLPEAASLRPSLSWESKLSFFFFLFLWILCIFKELLVFVKRTQLNNPVMNS